MNVLEGPLVLVDIETNGLNHVRGRVIEVAAIRIEDGKVVRTFNKLLDPETPIPYFITQLTGITDHDVADAPTFAQVAEELYEVLDGAVFVAHNVRFDYSFLKQEFKNVGKAFSPKQLCTVRLSRALYPQHRTHKLADIIARHDIVVSARHRAYDDAAVLWEFLQIIQREFAHEQVQTAIAQQIKQPSVPKGLDAAVIDALPETPGVYVFEDEAGRPIYVGKSVHIRTRVKSHFAADHEHVGEFKIAQSVRNIRVHETGSELEALLLESRLIKELQPLYNRQLRRVSKLLVAKQLVDERGYVTIALEESDGITIDEIPQILAVYAHRGKARESIRAIVKDFDLCPKLCGTEKASSACFSHQLHKCKGACVGAEATGTYNERLQTAFARQRVQEWPYAGPVLVHEPQESDAQHDVLRGLVIDQWCVVGHVSQEPYCSPVFTAAEQAFDLDTYKILRAQLAAKAAKMRITPLNQQQLHDFST